jgi:hypothetical protein
MTEAYSNTVCTLAKTAKQAAATVQSVLASLWSPFSLSSKSTPLCDECINLGWNYILRGQLIFSDQGIYFRCHQDTWAEDSIELLDSKRPLWGAMEEVQPLYLGEDTPADRLEANFAEYTYDVRAYTARTLSHPEDILRAFAGILSNLQRDKLQCRFLWGLPCCHFDSALLWKSVDIWDYDLWEAPTEPTGHDSSSNCWSSSDDSDDSEHCDDCDDSSHEQQDETDERGNESSSSVAEAASGLMSGESKSLSPYWEEEGWSKKMSRTRLLERRPSFPS